MDADQNSLTRKSLHQLNNDLSIASIEIELTILRLQKTSGDVAHDEWIRSCETALAAIRRAGRIANETLHRLPN